MTAFDTHTRTLISRTQLNRPLARRLYWTALVVSIVVFAFLFLFPLYWLFSSGLKSASEVEQIPQTLIPHSWQWSNFSTAWSSYDLGRFIFNTAYYAFGAVVLQLVFDVAAAYALSKLRPVLGNVVLGLMLATLMIPATVLVIPNYLTAVNVPVLHWNLINNPMAIWLPSVANGFNIFLLKRFFDSIPEELMAAAAIDGAGPLRALRSIVLPMSRPILAVVSIFAMVAVWKDVLWPLLVINDTSKMTINVGLLNLTGDGIPLNIEMASLAVAAVPTIVFFLIFQRNIMAGLTAGSLKG
ncbi:carbohydrate ABC transporter permease [Actinospica robiniae]|uniref:carbohydrate ABC transporter permease n=1 Tax=Actinospica robiniae TaxID=304901 RepID=UPI00041A8318|nr:carbohydrate ABC transporter permease [Actinospica robiniae]